MGRTPAGLAIHHSDGHWLFPRHLQLLNHILIRLMAGELRRVVLNMPPRFGKSQLFSKYLPACYLGNNPDHSVILSSYEAEFAAQWGGKAKQVMLDVGQQCYGLTLGKISDHRWTIAGHDGSMQTAGAGGAITGKGAHLFLIDDPVKNSQDAMSVVQQEHQFDWLLSTALTRLEPTGALAILMTRWAENDMTGRVLELAKETGEVWTHVSLPAICEDETSPTEQYLGRKNGDALWPERFSVEQLGVIKKRSYFWWNGLYQQRPAPIEGHLVKKAWLRYFSMQVISGQPFAILHTPEGDQRLALTDCRLFFTVDLAASLKTSADFTVVSVWALWPTKGILLWLDAVDERMEGPDQEALIAKLYHQYKPSLIGIEATSYQLTLIQALLRQGLPIHKLQADKDKVSRFIPSATMYQNGLIYHPLHAPWLERAEPQLLSFPNAAHDDFVDTVAYASRMIYFLTGIGEMPLEGY